MQDSCPSNTAKLIAQCILLAARDRNLQSLVAEGEPDALRRILTIDHDRDWLLTALKIAPARWFFLGVERLLLPGIITHYLARKRQIEIEVEQAIAHGCRRVVVIAAGYDTLAWRLHRKHPAVQFIELDHPATQQVKHEALGQASNFCFQPIDLVAELPSTALSKISSEAIHPTAVVVEGLTMYFQPNRVAELMRDLSSCAGPGGSVVFTFMERDKTGSIAFRRENPLVARWLKARSEPFLWGISRDELPTFLKTSGLEPDRLADHEVLRREQLQPRNIEQLPLAEGELICTASPLSQ